LNETQVNVVNPTCLVNGSITGISASGGTNSYTYSWQPGNINSLNLQNLTAGNYILSVTDANGCSDTSALYTLTPPNYPIASFTYTPLLPNLGDSVTFTNTSTNYTSEQWVNAGITVFQPSPWSYSYTAGTFQVTLTVTNNEGCVDTANAFITVYDQIQVPNVFSPNDDMINDVLFIQSLKPGTALTILNRWGNVVYYSESYANNWDGKDQNGNDVTEGVYTIILTDLQKTNTSYYFIHLTR
jgi:gliding motility-associated-like protein